MDEDSLSAAERWEAFWFLLILPLLAVTLYLDLLATSISLFVLVASAALALVLRWGRESKFTFLDIGFSLYVGAIGLSCWHSVYKPNSVLDLKRVTIGLLLYVSLRSYTAGEMTALSFSLSLLGAGTALYALLHWLRAFVLVKQAGFTSLLPFRRNLSWGGPDGYSGNEALRFVIFCGIGLLSAVTVPRKCSWMRVLAVACLFLNATCLLLTLSRLVFATLIVSCVVLITVISWQGLHLRRNDVTMIAGVAVSIALLGMSLGLAGDVINVLSMAKTPSQLRSITGRATVAAHGWELVRQHWIWGVGAGNYGYESCLGKTDNDGCAPEAFNWFLQTALELGIFGVLSSLVLWAGVLRTCIHLRFKKASLWTTCALSVNVAILAFNVGQSAMFFNPRLTALCSVWFAIVATGVESRTECNAPYVIL